MTLSIQEQFDQDVLNKKAAFDAKTKAKLSPADIADNILPMVPDELKKQNRWLTWSGDPKNKQPFVSGTNTPASTNNPEHLVSFEIAAVNKSEGQGYAHFGFVPIHPIFGLDLDSCRDPQTGEVKQWAIELLKLIGETYTEITPSLSGLRPWIKLEFQPEQKKYLINRVLGTVATKAPNVQLLTANYGTITGEPYNNAPSTIAVVTEKQWGEIEKHLRSLAPEPEAKTSASSGSSPWSEAVRNIKAADGDVEQLLVGLPDVEEGGRDNYLASVAGNLRQGSKLHDPWSKENGLLGLQAINKKKCHPSKGGAPERIVNSIWKRPIKDNTPIPVPFSGYAQVVEGSAQANADVAAEASQDAEGKFPFGEETIPDFDDTVITGSFRKIVDAVCLGTTIPRQYGLHAAKALACSIMTQHRVKLQDCESARTYFITFGESGTGKGWVFRRLQTIIDQSQNQREYVKIIHSVDSGAGLRDAFFDIPPAQNIPIFYFVDEVRTVGHKADGKKNPEIIDSIIELANSTTVSRTLAKKSKFAASKTRPDSWLLLYACAQNGEAYATAFPRTKMQGLPDRFIPEYSPKVIAGKKPEPDMNLGLEGIAEMHYNASKNPAMTMAADVEAKVEEIWNTQPEELQKSPRLREQFILELYLAAFSRGSAVAEAQDLEIAVKALERQKPIRAKFFNQEIPNQVGVYSNRLNGIHREMMRRLRRGINYGDVALSLPQLMTQTLAYKENDLPNFNQAWKAQGPFWTEVQVKSRVNGHTYLKFIPMPEDNDMWLPVDGRTLT